VLEKSLKNHAMSVYADVCRAKSTSTHLPSLSTVCLQYVSVLLLQFAFFAFPVDVIIADAVAATTIITTQGC